MMRWNRPCVGATVCKSHARALHARARFWCARGGRAPARRLANRTLARSREAPRAAPKQHRSKTEA
eukprot:8786399-Lingulodinium_polyedra.AAC.1